MADMGDLSYMYNTDQEIGTLPTIMFSKGLTFTPAEINMSIRPGWFWHEQEEPHSLERLFRTYITSYGANACMHLNLPPNRDGLIDERDVKRLQEFGDLIRKEFGTPIPCTVEKEEGGSPLQPKYHIHFDEVRKDVKYIVLREDIAEGQRVESFKIMAHFPSGAQFPLYQGTVIGNRMICMLQDPFALQNPLIDDRRFPGFQDLTLQITSARDEVIIKDIQVF